ncbi:hypothetical protein FKW77_010876 [Venturia effusa]|uniref:Glycosyltransferase family 25 protein n=1 Tax=Venturia effusa TaxID=50376 RepID=A0A517KYP9_9PEZI|nr:hypothetical protein FKW77_010876 [Venturia effusa]
MLRIPLSAVGHYHPNPTLHLEEVAEVFEQLRTEFDTKPPKHGSTIAWLAHFDILKYVIMSGFSSALIVEDDVDWDFRLKAQLQLVSDQIRNLTNPSGADQSPYGTAWDVLWIGHRGDRPESPAAYAQYLDDSHVLTHNYNGWSKSSLIQFIPEGLRRIQQTVQPVCTFGYAVTSAGAQIILTILSAGKDEAYDVALQHLCGKQELRCYSVIPELMYHYQPLESSEYVSETNELSGGGASASDDVLEKTMGETRNIVESAQCRFVIMLETVIRDTTKQSVVTNVNNAIFVVAISADSALI